MGTAGTAAAATKGKGRPRKDDRQIINGILWRLRTGTPWRDLPERYGPWRTVATRFYRWQRDGVWQQLLAAVHEARDNAGAVAWTVHYVDGTVVSVQQHAAGAKGVAQPPRQ